MRTLTETLLAAQKQPSSTPYVKVEAKNKVAGAVRYDWSRLYTGSEADHYHALTIAGDGSLIRARITPSADGNKLYRQRVANPGSGSDFSQWVYTNQFNAVAVACASLGAEVSIFWIDGVNRKIQRLKSTDSGATWGSPELIDYSPTIYIYGLAVAYKPNGDLAIFFADQSTLYVKKHTGGSWQTKSTWDKTTGNLSGVAAVYSGDWNLLVTGKDTSGNFKLWGLVYGDGGDVAIGTWSDLKELASAPSDGDFSYRQPFLDKPDVYRTFFVEKYTGDEAYNRPLWSHTVPELRFVDSLWREPVPFDLSSGYGLAIAHYGDYCWLSSPASVWRASLTPQSLDLTADVLMAKEELTRDSGKLVIELRNDDGRYATPGVGSLVLLDIGCQVDFSPGYRTASGNEVSEGSSFSLEAYEHTSSGGKASLVLHLYDGWKAIADWRARHQFRWNKSTDEMSVKDILGFVLARVGLKLGVVSQSTVITGFYPDFTIGPGDRGDTIVRKLLSFVPDVIFIEGSKAYLVNPQSTDSLAYSYGTAHPIFVGHYQTGAWELNRVQVEGDDAGTPVIVERFAWEEIDRVYDRLRQIEDRNIDTLAKAQQRGDAYLRKAEIESAGGSILVPVNCGQQLYDVIDITDSRAGLTATKRRVLRIVLTYNPARGEYAQKLYLDAV